MSLLVRKIEVGKWKQNDIENGEPVSADAITNCTKTKDNALSVWNIANEEALQDAILAISSAGDYLDTFDVVLLDESSLLAAGLFIVPKTGQTPAERLADTHRDIVKLTYLSLGTLANAIVEGFKAKRVRRFTRGELKKILKQAIGDGVIRAEDLKESLRSQLN